MLSREELDRLVAEDQYKDRRIVGSVYCGTCGYCLRTLPYVYNCPECGEGYNARPLVMRGIFLPHQAAIPYKEMALTAFCALFAVSAIRVAVPVFHWAVVTMVGVAAVIGAVCGWQACGQWRKVLQSRDLARRIAEAEKFS